VKHKFIEADFEEPSMKIWIRHSLFRRFPSERGNRVAVFISSRKFFVLLHEICITAGTSYPVLL
jgi:hypothetical protein